jgi:hypothetical protein
VRRFREFLVFCREKKLRFNSGRRSPKRWSWTRCCRRPTRRAPPYIFGAIEIGKRPNEIFTARFNCSLILQTLTPYTPST